MTLFSWLINSVSEWTLLEWNESYLSESINRLRAQKQGVVSDILWQEYRIQRPSLAMVDPRDTQSILRFVAKAEKPPSYLLAYFEVQRWESPQETDVSNPIFEEFRRVYHLAQLWSENQ